MSAAVGGCTLTIKYKKSCASSCGATVGARARRTKKMEEQKNDRIKKRIYDFRIS